jgi:hypothetical protein
MTVPGDAYNLSSTFTNAFKRVFVQDNKVDIFFFDNELLKRIKVTDGFIGTDEERVRATSFAGGYGFGSTMPRANESNLIRPRLEAKKYYARAILDTESMAASMGTPGAFFDLVNRVKLDVNRSIENGLSLSLLKSNVDNDVLLGVIDGSPTGSDPYVATISAASWHKQNFHIKQIVNVETGDTDPFEVTAITESSRQVTLDRLSGSQAPADTDEIFLQGSEANGFTGLKGVTASSGTLYNVTIGAANGWVARATDKSDVEVDENMLYNELLQVKNVCGKSPNLIACGLTQYLKIAEFLANKRQIWMPDPKAIKNSDVMGHAGIQLQCDEGPVDIIWDRLIENDRLYVLNSNHMELRKRPLSGMATVGGDILMPDYINDLDRYIITYRCYGDFYIEPTYQAVLTNLGE